MIPGVKWWQAPTSGIWHIIGIGPQPRKEIEAGEQLLCGWVKRDTPVVTTTSPKDTARVGACCRTCAGAILRTQRRLDNVAAGGR